MQKIASPATSRLSCSASTSAPAGSWLAIATNEPTESAKPMSCGLQPAPARKTGMNGPKPVCRAATKKFSQFRLLWLLVAAIAARSRLVAADHTRAPASRGSRRSWGPRAARSVADGAQLGGFGQKLVRLDVILRHPAGGEAALELLADTRAVELAEAADCRDRAGLVRDD